MEGRELEVRDARPRNRKILLVGDPGMKIEDITSFAQELGIFGDVLLPDLPGLGGMQSFMKIGQKPTLANYSAYLASYVKLRFRNDFEIVTLGDSLPIVIGMLQRFPSVAARTKQLVALGGHIHYHDLKMSYGKRKIMTLANHILAAKLFLGWRTKACLQKSLLNLDVTSRRLRTKFFYFPYVGRYPLDLHDLVQHQHIVFDQPSMFVAKKIESLKTIARGDSCKLPASLKNVLRHARHR